MNQWNMFNVHTEGNLHYTGVSRAGAALRGDATLKYPILNMLSLRFVGILS